MKRIGIDVGPSSTDLVMLDGPSAVAHFRAPSGSDGIAGVVEVLDDLRKTTTSLGEVRAVVVGSRFLIDCLDRVEGVARTGVIRFGSPASASVPPMMGWPAQLAGAVGSHIHLCHGGRDINGNEISPFDMAEVTAALDQLAGLLHELVTVVSHAA